MIRTTETSVTGRLGVSRASNIHNTVASANGVCNTFEDRLLSRDDADTHEKTLKALYVDTYDLWNMLHNGFILLRCQSRVS